MKRLIFLLFLFFLLQNQGEAQCWPPCGACELDGVAIVNSLDCNVTNEITVTINDGVGPFSFSIREEWGPSTPPIIQDGRTYTYKNLKPGRYTVWVVDTELCIFELECILAGPLEAEVKVNTFCEDNLVCVTPWGGTLPYKYSWSDGICCQDDNCRDNFSPGNYQVTITDANHCNFVLSFEIQAQEKLEMDIVLQQPGCSIDSKITIYPSGGLGPYCFEIYSSSNPQAVYKKSSGFFASCSGLKQGHYKIRVKDRNNCEIEEDFVFYDYEDHKETIISISSCNPVLLPWGVIADEAGTYVNKYQTANGCDSTVFVVITPGEKKDTLIFASTCGPVLLPWGEIAEEVGNYEKIYQTTNGCDSVVTVYVSSLVYRDSLLKVEESCGVWISPSGELFTESGYYVNEIINGDGCPQRLITGVYIKDPTFENVEVPYCYGTTPSLYLDGVLFNQDTVVEKECGYVIIHFLELEETKVVHMEKDTICLAVGEEPFDREFVFLSVKNTEGCDSINYIMREIGIPAEEFIDSVYVCKGEEYFWNISEEIYEKEGIYEFIDYSDVCPKNYKLVIFEKNNGYVIKEEYSCEKNNTYSFIPGEGCLPDTIDIVRNAPDIYFYPEIQNISCFGEEDGSISLEIFSEDPDYEIFWSNGEIVKNVFNLSPGNYSVTLTNSYGCEIDSSFQIVEPDKLEILSIDSISITCNNLGSIQLEMKGGTPPYFFASNSTDGKLYNLPEGNYVITVVDANGCEIQSPEIVFLAPNCIPEPPEVSDCEILVKSVVGSYGPYVEINNERLTGELTYEVFDVSGNKFLDGNLGYIEPGFHFRGILSFPNLLEGNYVLVFRVSGEKQYVGALCFVLKK